MYYEYAKKYADDVLQQSLFDAIKSNIFLLLPSGAINFVTQKELIIMAVKFHNNWDWNFSTYNQLEDICTDFLKQYSNDLVIRALDEAVKKYSATNVNVCKNKINNNIDIIYRSSSNSFPIIPSVTKAEHVNFLELENYINKVGANYAW